MGYQDPNNTQEVTYIELEERLKEWNKDGNLHWNRDEFIAAVSEAGLYSRWNDEEEGTLTEGDISERVS